MTKQEILKHLIKQNRTRFNAARADRVNGCWDIEGTKRTDARLDEINNEFVELAQVAEALGRN